MLFKALTNSIQHTSIGAFSQVIWILLFHCRYVFCCSYAHNVAPKGKFIAFVSTEAETDKPEIELKPGIDLLGPVEETFFDIYDRYEPINNPEEDSCFLTNVSSTCSRSFYGRNTTLCTSVAKFAIVSQSYDASTHFETTVKDVLALYNKITGKVISHRHKENHKFLVLKCFCCNGDAN